MDTLHFGEDFKWALLAAVTKDHPLDESLDGVAIHSDNWQALNTMQEKYWERVQAVYADPPYNTDAGPISYKNGYRHSSWIALMEHRLTKSKTLLDEKGIFCITIDDSEFHRLRCLSEACLSEFDILGVATIKNNPAGRTTTSGFSVCHEYAVFLGREGFSEVNRLEHSQSQKDRYKEQDEIGFFEWTNFRKHGGVNTYKTTRPRQFYPIYVRGEQIRFPIMEWNEKLRKWDVQESPIAGEEVIWPIDEKDNERIWDFGAETAKSNIFHLKVKKDSKGKTAIYRKWRINDEGLLPQTWWDKSVYSAVEHGTNLLSKFFGEAHVFMFPKSIYAVEDCIRVAGMRNNANGIALDLFAGSGTVGHAIINLNRADGGCRQFILVEANSYIDKATIPRLKKVAAANEWNVGIPVELNGPGLFMRVQRLEQYEDTLENLAIAAGENRKLFAGQEALAYDLDAEAKRLLFASPSFTAPFGLTLKRIAGADVETGPVDLVESLVYLLGLHVERLYREQGSVVITGALNRRHQTAAVFWRSNAEHGADWLQAKMAEHPADRYYTNDPARLSFPGVERFAAIETVFVEGMA